MKSLILLGFRGCGKTTLGKQLAERLGWSFLDLDADFETRAGETILAFVKKNGLDAFRKQESALLARALENVQPFCVIATGGGIVDWPASRKTLAATALPKVFLEVPAEHLWQRLEGSADRREIGQLADYSQLQQLLALRLPFYEKIATFRVRNQDINEALAKLEALAQSL